MNNTFQFKSLMAGVKVLLVLIMAIFTVKATILKSQASFNTFPSNSINSNLIYINPNLFPVPLIDSRIAGAAGNFFPNSVNAFQTSGAFGFDPFFNPFAAAQSQFPVPLIPSQIAAQGLFQDFTGINSFQPTNFSQGLFPVSTFNNQNAANGQFFPSVNNNVNVVPRSQKNCSCDKWN